MPFGTKAIADRAYTSESVCATRNDEFDDPCVRQFKRRARAWHENFNARIKVYNALTIPFRHGVEKHGAVFDQTRAAVELHQELCAELDTGYWLNKKKEKEEKKAAEKKDAKKHEQKR